ncbi:unnamed protein product [Rhizophagus irregularis]|nr:unnamed protein product [Rhizophagus irregularis]CAB5201125.1 unnamed protein product [Rhizophagus irregularis]
MLNTDLQKKKESQKKLAPRRDFAWILSLPRILLSFLQLNFPSLAFTKASCLDFEPGLQLSALKNKLGYYWTLDFGFGARMNSDITGLKISVLEDGLGLQILALK